MATKRHQHDAPDDDDVDRLRELRSVVYRAQDKYVAAAGLQDPKEILDAQLLNLEAVGSTAPSAVLISTVVSRSHQTSPSPASDAISRKLTLTKKTGTGTKTPRPETPNSITFDRTILP